jgi:copper oxidase (laccase) domain-containing protein
VVSVGVPARSNEASPICTNCHTDLLFSYGAEKGKTGRMMAGGKNNAEVLYTVVSNGFP